MFGPHVMDGITPLCKLCEKRIPPALAASGCEKNTLDYEKLAEAIVGYLPLYLPLDEGQGK